MINGHVHIVLNILFLALTHRPSSKVSMKTEMLTPSTCGLRKSSILRK